jgi:AcrR family transcriptional regulator
MGSRGRDRRSVVGRFPTMGCMNFQRARSEEQRNERRRTILATASAMLREMPVASVSLNELSRRVDLAKSNVLRYFESREAVLLDLLDAELAGWADELDGLLVETPAASAVGRARDLAKTLTATMASRPVMCDLIAAQTAVLERNISADVALRHKRDVGAVVARIDRGVVRVLPELTEDDAYQVLSVTLLMASACWPQSNPAPALVEAYEADPAVAASRRTFTEGLEPPVYLTVRGLLADTEDPGPRA